MHILEIFRMNYQKWIYDAMRSAMQRSPQLKIETVGISG